VLLPFLFACFRYAQKLLEVGRDPVLLLFLLSGCHEQDRLAGAGWLVFVLLLSRVFEPKLPSSSHLLGPIFVGVLLFVLFKYEVIPYEAAIPYFEVVNFRMVAVPSSAIDVYNDFFQSMTLPIFARSRF